MKYYEEMTSKYGFSDGDAIPNGAEQYREVYVTAINALARAKESKVRAYAYNRPGMHNWCLILFVDQSIGEIDAEGSETFPEKFTAQPDEAMELCLELAAGLNLDAWLAVTVEIDPDFDDYVLSGRLQHESQEAAS